MNIIEAPQSRESIEIPVRNSQEVVEVFLEDLPSAGEVIDILRDESSPLILWHQFAIEYYRHRRLEDFEKISIEASSFDPSSFSPQETKIFISILNALAAYYLHLSAIDKKDEGARNDLIGKAASLLNRAQYIDLHDEYTWLVKSIFHIRKNDWDAALDHTSTFLAKSEHVLAVLASAVAYFNKQEYQRALRAFRRVICLVEQVPPLVYLGIAYSFFKLRLYAKSKLAFERVLELLPNAASALSGIALCEFHLDTSSEAIVRGMALLKRAYDLDATSSLVLTHLASHFFYRRDYAKAQALATNALQHADTPGTRADAAFELARVFHVQNIFDAAHTYYSQAVNASPNHVLALFGLGQVSLALENHKAAKHAFEQVLAKSPMHRESMAILAHFYKSEDANRNKAIEYLTTLLSETHGEPRSPLLIDLAEACELDHLEMAINAYLEVASYRPSAEIYNNIAVMYERNLQLNDSLKYYQLALSSIIINDDDEGIVEKKAIRLSVQFNMACLLEKMGQMDQAEEIYKTLKNQAPAYADASLRLGMLFEKKKDIEQAIQIYQETTPYSDNAWLLLGNAYVTQRDYKQALSSFEKIGDSYGLISTANTHVHMGRHASHSEVQEREFKKAMDIYCSVLSQNPNHQCAVNGIATVLAYRKDFVEAKTLFLKVKEATQQLDAWINLAHTLVELGQFANAIKLYDLCAKKCQGGELLASIHVYTARAAYLLGKEMKDLQALRKARMHLEQAISSRPQDQSLVFNMALALEESGVVILKSEKHARTLEDLHTATRSLTTALEMFKELSNVSDSQQYDRKAASQRVKYCETLLNSALKHTEVQEEETKSKEAKLERIKAARRVE